MISGISQTTSAWTTYTLTGLTYGVVYSITVAAINSQGTGTPTSPIQGSPYTLSGPPSSFSGQLVDGLLVLSWLPPGVIGGAAVTGYQIEGILTEGGMWTVVVPNTGSVATTHTFGYSGETFSFRISAINAAGVGPASGSWLITTPTTTTMPPTTTSTRPPARGMVPPRPVYIG